MTLYGGGTSDYAVTPSGRILPGQGYTVWTSEVAGTQVTGVMNWAGAAYPSNVVVADAQGRVKFQTPGSDIVPVWLQAVGDPSGVRVYMDPSNLAQAIGDAVTLADTVEDSLTEHETRLDGHDVSISNLDGAITTLGPRNASNGYAGLDMSGKIPNSLLYGSTAPPSCRMYRSAVYNAATSMTIIGWDAEEWEDNVTANALHSTSTNSSRITASATGKWRLTASIEFDSLTTVQQCRANVRKNAAGVNSGGTSLLWASARTHTTDTNTWNIALPLEGVFKLVAGDYVEVFLTSTIASHTVNPGIDVTWAVWIYEGA